jgi:hypothetical protein
MTIDPRKIRKIVRVCATLSKSAPTAEEHDIFADLALKWLNIAPDRESRLAIDLDRFDDDGGAPSVSVAVEKVQVSRRSPLGGVAIGNFRVQQSHAGVCRTVVSVCRFVGQKPNLGEPKGLRQRMIVKWNREIEKCTRGR